MLRAEQVLFAAFLRQVIRSAFSLGRRMELTFSILNVVGSWRVNLPFADFKGAMVALFGFSKHEKKGKAFEFHSTARALLRGPHSYVRELIYARTTHTAKKPSTYGNCAYVDAGHAGTHVLLATSLLSRCVSSHLNTQKYNCIGEGRARDHSTVLTCSTATITFPLCAPPFCLDRCKCSNTEFTLIFLFLH
jgi:hypothetical protein